MLKLQAILPIKYKIGNSQKHPDSIPERNG